MYRIFSILITLAALSFGLSACEQDPSSTEPTGNPSQLPMAAPTKTTPDAHPAFLMTSNDYFLYRGQYIVRNRLSVSDADLTDHTVVYTCGSQDDRLSFASWSASGASASFVEKIGSTTYIKTIDISVPTSGKTTGVPQASNLRTITSTTNKILGQVWGKSSNASLIAYMTESSSEYAVYTISTSGGSPTKIYSIASASGSLSGLSWSPDGSQLALSENNGSDFSIKLISTSGTVNTTLVSGTYQSISQVRWSNSGTNQLAYSAVPAGVTPGYNGILGLSLYLINTTSGSTPTQLKAGWTEYDEIEGYNNPCWSPDNTELMFSWMRVGYTFSGTSVSSIANTEPRLRVLSTGAETKLDLNYTIVRDWKQPL